MATTDSSLEQTPWRLSRVIMGGALAFGVILGFLPVYSNNDWMGAILTVINCLIFGAAYLFLCGIVFPRLRDSNATRLWVRQSLVAIATMSLVAFLVANLSLYIDYGLWMFSRADDGTFIAADAWTIFALPILPIAGLAVTQFNQSWAPMMALELRARRADELAATAQLQALRAQINPHFLFNSLNSIAQLIASEPARAEQCVQRLAEIYRYLLSSTDRAFVPLSDELEITDGYLDIERARFGRQLRVETEICEGAQNAIVPVLVLQPLVENAVRHGVSQKVAGGTVSIRARIENRVLILNVDDTGVGMNGTDQWRGGGGIGLRNVRERIIHLYGEKFVPRIWSEPGKGTRIELRLPVTPPDTAARLP